MQRRMIPIAASGYALVRQSALVYAAIAQDEFCQALQDSRHASILCVDKQPTTRVADGHNPQLELAFGDKTTTYKILVLDGEHHARKGSVKAIAACDVVTGETRKAISRAPWLQFCTKARMN